MNLFGLSKPAMGVILSLLPTFLAAVAAFITYTYIRRRNSFLSQLQGPKSHSFWIGEYQKYWFCASATSCVTTTLILPPWPTVLGNEGDIYYQNEVGDCEFGWVQQYGSAWRRRGCLGVSVFHR